MWGGGASILPPVIAKFREMSPNGRESPPRQGISSVWYISAARGCSVSYLSVFNVDTRLGDGKVTENLTSPLQEKVTHYCLNSPILAR